MRALQGMIKQRTGGKRENHTGDSSMEVASSIRKNFPISVFNLLIHSDLTVLKNFHGRKMQCAENQ